MKSENAVTPKPVTVTPELLAQHSITAEEYERILAALGRTPSLTELGIYSVMWSEHCSYKSSRVHLKRLPTESDRVVQGPGENAGIIDVGDGWACAFKIESHNHPSYIEPFQGAATGVGGILRDIFTMNARPLAVMDSLRFGPIEPGSADAALVNKNHSVLEGVVHGIAAYGNCFGVPNLGGETRFEPCYSGNPLVNAFALGLVRRDEIFYAKATGVGNPVIYAGAKTGRDGIHGATMASEEFKEGSEQKRPNVQVGDPFMEKLLLEACIEAMKTGAVVGIQDMGAAGLTSSSCEMGARGGVGVEMNLDQIPQRETNMTAYEMMLSESQERMLLVAEKGREQEVLDVFYKWGLDATIVGTVIADPRMRIVHKGELMADIPNTSLTDDAPRYHRPVGVWKAPVPAEPSPEVLAELNKTRDYTADLKQLLASSNVCDKRWVFEQYDSMVQTNTVQGPGAEAGVMRIKGTGTPGHERGLSMALAGNGRWCYLNPELGAQHAVAEAARKVACTGATPVATTNCLNFGNPEKPEIMAQLSSAIDGIAAACKALGTPVTGGNVSLYNETKGEGIYPTPVLGIVGVIDDVTKAVPSGFQREGDSVAVLAPFPADTNLWKTSQKEFGSSEYAKVVLGQLWGEPPAIELESEAKLNQCLAALAEKQLIHSASDLSEGGLPVALAEACFAHGIGVKAAILPETASHGPDSIFAERPSWVLISYDQANHAEIMQMALHYQSLVQQIGKTVDDRIVLSANLKTVIDSTVADLRAPWADSLEATLHDHSANEVLA
ncbi:phosphoribosylformylglycinamidine synthase subunit PurL [Silvibacterium dinghuense]|uniref:Phosphoribosylformylglycinamidine synthase subunit PurL n=1 Tax=Silvibacterium dinghuense TaxID=1560006 RepID=A0A4Q1SJJ4_9BACT|nr:phosphoribosylformylglycinamidine synthase subunit PurL [Silvibacterium dinghuense]RXS97607.1 phosphoribosylformylglycinamidine synthase subunit PurL [Silvibacterium dinghuense]GGH00442.1 phosphoribosylformylglycinamidine synthase subunit PurL [Silvibacterium dinghuense]